jgi:hypothetical protein
MLLMANPNLSNRSTAPPLHSPYIANISNLFFYIAANFSIGTASASRGVEVLLLAGQGSDTSNENFSIA